MGTYTSLCITRSGFGFNYYQEISRFEDCNFVFSDLVKNFFSARCRFAQKRFDSHSNDNLEEEFDLIREIVDDYPYIAMDTEFPGVVLRPVGNFKNNNDYHYQTLKDNVDLLKLIQLGLTFSDENGNLPKCGPDKYCIWQFNFCDFNPNEDVYANDSIELLRQSG